MMSLFRLRRAVMILLTLMSLFGFRCAVMILLTGLSVCVLDFSFCTLRPQRDRALVWRNSGLATMMGELAEAYSRFGRVVVVNACRGLIKPPDACKDKTSGTCV